MSTSWRDFFPIHPAADIFPMMTDAELTELGEDIRTNGLTSSIVFIAVPGGLAVLDGRNRLDAMAMAGMDPVWEAKQRKLVLPANTDPFGFVISANIHRRHLTAEQKRDLIARLLKAAPGKSDRQIAAVAKVSHPTVAIVRKSLERSGDVVKFTTRQDAAGRKQPVKRAARAPSVPGDKAPGIILGNPNASVRMLSKVTGLPPAAIKRFRASDTPSGTLVTIEATVEAAREHYLAELAHLPEQERLAEIEKLMSAIKAHQPMAAP